MANLADLDALLDEPPKAMGGNLADLDAMLDAPEPAAPAKSRVQPLPEPEEAPDLTRPAGVMGRTIRPAKGPAPPLLDPTYSDVGNAIAGGAADAARYVVGAPGTKRSFAGDVGGGLADVNTGLWGVARGGVENLNEFLPGKPLAPVTEFTNRMGTEAKRISEVASPPVTPDESALVRGITSGVKSAAQSVVTAPAMLVNPAFGLGLFGAVAGGQSYQEAREKGITPPQAAIYAGSQGAIEAGTEMLPAMNMLKNLRMGSTLSKTFRDLLAREMPGEQAATILQDANKVATLEPNKTWGDYLAERPSAALDTAIATVISSGGMAGAGHIARAAEVRAAAQSANPAARAEAAAYGSERPEDVLAAALSGQPVIDPVHMNPDLKPAQQGWPVAPRTEVSPYASQPAPVPPGAGGPAPLAPGEPAPAVPPAGGQLGGDAGIAGAIGGIDPAGGTQPGAALYGQQHVPAPYDDPAAALRGAAPDPLGIAGIIAGAGPAPVGGIEPAPWGDEPAPWEQPQAPQAGIEPSPWEGEAAPWEAPPPPEQPWAQRGAEEEGQALSEEESARLGELDGLLGDEPEEAPKPFGFDPEKAAGQRATAAPEEDIEATIRRKRAEEQAAHQQANADFEADEAAVYGTPETELEHAEARLRRAQHAQKMSNRFGIPKSWDANGELRAAQEAVAAALKGPTSNLRPGTPAYVERLREGFKPRTYQRDINAYKADVRRGEKFGTDNPVLGMLESYQLDEGEAGDYGADFGRVKVAKINRKGRKVAGTTGTGHQKYFRQGGMKADELAERLWQDGFIRREEMGDQNLVQDIVRKALNAGEKGAGPQPVYSHGYIEAQGKAQQDAEHAANMLEEIDRVDAKMVEIVYELADRDPEAFDVMLQVLTDNAGDEAKSRQAIRGHYNQYYADQQAAVAARGRPAGPGSIDPAGQEPARQGPEPTGNQGSTEEGTGDAPGEAESDTAYAPDDWLMSPAEAAEYEAIRRIPYDQRTDDQHERYDELDEDYSNYRRETLFADPPETVNASKEPGEVKSQAEADAQLAEWKRIALAQTGNSNKTVLSIFDATGQWSQPWYDAGYNVITLDIKNGQDLMDITSIEHINELTGGETVDVVLAAIPCTDFAALGAQWWHEKDRDGVTKGSIELAQRALAVIEYLQPDVWTAENPVGRIKSLTTLPEPRMSFHPADYGDPYTKKTLLYGKFNSDLPINRVAPSEGSRIHRLSSTAQDARSITPEGFAYAYFMANGGEGFGPVEQNVPHGEPTETPDDEQDPGAAPEAAEAEEAAGDTAPAPAVGNEADPGVDGLQTYTPDELKAHDERVRRLERERIAAEKEAERKAKADAEVDEFTLTGSDREADADPNQGAMFDVVPGATEEQLSRMPPGAGFGRGFEAQAITQRPSRHTDAWTAMGLTPAQGANLPIAQAIKRLQALYQRDFGLKVEVADNAIPVETRDSLLDGYRGISDMMYRMALPLTAVSLNGTLTLRLEPFNKKNAYYGMYDPNARRIHMPGRSNSFGHEWMHALDHFITDLAGRDGKEGLFSMLVGAQGINNPASELQSSFAELVNRMFFGHEEQAWEILKLQVEASAMNRNGGFTVAAREAQAKLEKMTGGQIKANKDVTPTAYATSAYDFQPGSTYWNNPAEMLARAFEAYLASQRPPDMLNEFVGKSDAAYRDDADERLRMTFPKQHERDRIFNAFDDLFSALRGTHELGTGPKAERPEGEGVFDPSKWGQYPDNETRWQRTVQGQLDAFRQWRLPTLAGTKSAVKLRAGKVNHFWHATFLANRSNLDLIAKKYNNAPPLRRINDLLYANRGTGRTQEQTLDEAVVTRSHSRNNELAQLMRLSGLKELSDDENRLLRYMLVSAESMLDNEDVQEQLGQLDVSNISTARIDKLEKLATELRKFLDKEWYYNTRNGIELGYARNGYMPRVFNYAKVFDNLDDFETAAAKVYGAQFDRQVGTDTDTLNEEEFARSLREVRHSASSELIALAKQLRSVNAKIRYQERQLATSEDPDAVQNKLAELYDERTELLGEMLPILRKEWSNQAALQWRTHMATGELTEYDTHGPSVSYMRGRTLPPEADVLMADFYNQDVLDAVATYSERSSRRVEYAVRFGVQNEKLNALLEDAAMRFKVHRSDLDQVKQIVNNATGRESHGVPQRAQDGLNAISSWMTLYMLGRATFASVTESMAAGIRTRKMGDYVRGFGSIVADIRKTDDAQARQALAEALGLIALPGHDALMGNRLAGDSLTREASLRAARYFEYIGLGALTRAQVRSTLPIATAYMRTLGRKAVAGHRPSREELMGLGIPPDQQRGFTEWLTTKVETPQPTPADLMDRNTDEFHQFGQLYAVAAKRFSSQVIMEPTKMDKPKLATHPAARFLWGIQSFNMALWHNVTKPMVLQMLRDADTVARGEAGGKNAGRTRAESATNLATAGIAIGMAFNMQLISTIIRAALLDWDKWQEKEKKGELWSWLSELAFWRMGAAGLLDPLVQAFRGIKYQRDITGLSAGAQFGALLQNIQDMVAPFQGTNSPNTNTAERKAAKAVWNTAGGPLIAWATSAAPLGPLVGPVLGLINVYAGSGKTQNAVADIAVGPSNSPAAKKAAKAASGDIDSAAELKAERKARRAEEKAANAAVN